MRTGHRRRQSGEDSPSRGGGRCCSVVRGRCSGHHPSTGGRAVGSWSGHAVPSLADSGRSHVGRAGSFGRATLSPRRGSASAVAPPGTSSIGGNAGTSALDSGDAGHRRPGTVRRGGSRSPRADSGEGRGAPRRRPEASSDFGRVGHRAESRRARGRTHWASVVSTIVSAPARWSSNARANRRQRTCALRADFGRRQPSTMCWCFCATTPRWKSWRVNWRRRRPRAKHRSKRVTTGLPGHGVRPYVSAQ